MIRYGRWCHDGGLSHNHFASRRKRGLRRPPCGSTAIAAASTYGVSTAQARHDSGLDPSDWQGSGARRVPHQSGRRCDLGPASAFPTVVRPAGATTRVLPSAAALRMRDAS